MGPKSPARRRAPLYRLVLEYDGTRYHGWQEQQNARAVAGELRRAVEGAAGAVVDLQGSGRTDAGVHALAQVAHLRLEAWIEPDLLRTRVNDLLPPDVHLLAVAAAPAGFHARHAAVARSYLYQISRRRTAFAKRYVWWVKHPLDAGRMAATARRLAGRHDFASFCERPSEQSSTIVVVESAEIVECGSLILFRVVASHFLWKMVRRLTGTLVEVGRGALAPERVEALLAGPAGGASAGAPARWTAPPSGLFLERVLYPGDPPLGPPAPAFGVGAESGRAG